MPLCPSWGWILRTRVPGLRQSWGFGLGGAWSQTTFVRHKASSHVGVAQEITERKLLENQLAAANAALNDRALQLEQTVAERTAKLRDAIDSLEHFSYTITHDMRAPLRPIQGFAAILRAECEHLPSA